MSGECKEQTTTRTFSSFALTREQMFRATYSLKTKRNMALLQIAWCKAKAMVMPCHSVKTGKHARIQKTERILRSFYTAFDIVTEIRKVVWTVVRDRRCRPFQCKSQVCRAWRSLPSAQTYNCKEGETKRAVGRRECCVWQLTDGASAATNKSPIWANSAGSAGLWRRRENAGEHQSTLLQ